jgi:hypothetical protein
MAMVGNLPKDLDLIDLSPSEMMFWLYCPIKLAESNSVQLPSNLLQYQPIVDTVFRDMKATQYWVNEFDNDWYNSYIYLTAKTLFVSGDYIGNRPGWHCDGFGTEDLNYIWYDSAPTDFLICENTFEISDDCDISMKQMKSAAQHRRLARYPCKHLLKLDHTVVHRSPIEFNAGIRTFVKVSVSRDKYNLEGNSINHDIDFQIELKSRTSERNHPCRDFE